MTALILGDFLIEHYQLLGIIFWMILAVIFLLVFDVTLHIAHWRAQDQWDEIIEDAKEIDRAIKKLDKQVQKFKEEREKQKEKELKKK